MSEDDPKNYNSLDTAKILAFTAVLIYVVALFFSISNANASNSSISNRENVTELDNSNQSNTPEATMEVEMDEQDFIDLIQNASVVFYYLDDDNLPSNKSMAKAKDYLAAKGTALGISILPDGMSAEWPTVPVEKHVKWLGLTEQEISQSNDSDIVILFSKETFDIGKQIESLFKKNLPKLKIYLIPRTLEKAKRVYVYFVNKGQDFDLNTQSEK